MRKLLAELKQLLPDIKFLPAETFFWSPQVRTVHYQANQAEGEHNVWSLLHETAHALLDHKGYKYDLELLLLEVAAWQRAKRLASDFSITIDETYIQDCLDTYRDWLYRRSICPACQTVSLQTEPGAYQCHNCLHIWQVTTARFCRPYRKTKKLPANSLADSL